MAAANEPAELVTVDAAPRMAALQTFDAARGWVDAAGSATPVERLVRWGHPAPARLRPTVLLRDGSTIVASDSWTRSGSIGLDDAECRILSAIADETRLARAAVRAIWLMGGRDPALRATIAEELTSARDADRVWVTGGDRLDGTIVWINGAEVRLRPADDGEPVVLPLDRVVAVGLKSPATTTPAQLLVGLRDGSLLRTTSATIDEAGFRAQFAGGSEMRGPDADQVVFLQPLAGGVTYLSDLVPLDYRHTPYFALTIDHQRDANLTGDPCTAGGRAYAKSLAMPTAARLVYKLDAPYARFAARLAIDDAAIRPGQPSGSVVFRVYATRAGQLEEIYASPILRGGEPPIDIDLDITAAQALVLVTDYADYGDERDQALWLDARLVK